MWNILVTFEESIFLSRSELDPLTSKGWYELSKSGTCYRMGHVFERITLQRNLSCKASICRATAYTVGSIVMSPFCLISYFTGRERPFTLAACIQECCGIDGCTQRYCDDPCQGFSRRTIYLHARAPSEKVFRQDYEKLGLDIHSIESRKRFMAARSSDKIEYLKHHYLVFETPISRATKYIFVPQGDDWQKSSIGDLCDRFGRAMNRNESDKSMRQLCRDYRPGQIVEDSTTKKLPLFKLPKSDHPRVPRTRDEIARESALNADRRDAVGSLPWTCETQPLLG